MRVDSDAGRELIAGWAGQGHLIGNHSYSHLNLDNTSLAKFTADAVKNEPLIASYQHLTPLFRYPFFKEGSTVEKRDGMRSFLRHRGYRIGSGGIDYTLRDLADQTGVARCATPFLRSLGPQLERRVPLPESIISKSVTIDPRSGCLRVID